MASFSPSPSTSSLWQLSSHSLTLPQTSLFLRLHSRSPTVHVVRTPNTNFDPFKLGDDDDDNDNDNGNDSKFVRRRSGRRLRRQRQWWSGSNQVEGKQVGGIVDQLVDGLWILQVFRAYGVFLPIILISLLLATGPKAFLMGSGIPFGLSLLAFAFNKLSEWLDSNPTPKPKNRRKISCFSREQGVSGEGEDGQTRETDEDNRAKRRSYQTRDNRFGGWDELVTEDKTDSTQTPTTEARLKMMRESRLRKLNG